MPRALAWLPTVIRLSILPVVIGALALLVQPPHLGREVAAAVGLVLLAAIHTAYWWRPWHGPPRRAVLAAAGMLVTNFILLHLLGLDEPLLWLYPALIVGAGLRPPAAAVGVGLTALAAATPVALLERLMLAAGGVPPVSALGPSHSVLVSIVLAGLGMTAVRQLISVNADLRATRAELADVAVAAERERLGRELHDLLGRTLSLIAVKAELASRLSARGDASADAELADVQRLARQSVRDVRDAVSGVHAPSVDGELVAAEGALRSAGIAVSVENNTMAGIDPAHETTIAWALREGVTNVVKHSGARCCRITLETADGATLLEVEDDGRGPLGSGSGTGLTGLAERVHAVGGALDVGARGARGFKLRVRLGASVPGRSTAEVTG